LTGSQLLLKRDEQTQNMSKNSAITAELGTKISIGFIIIRNIMLPPATGGAFPFPVSAAIHHATRDPL
jgi:hypothetical protein